MTMNWSQHRSDCSPLGEREKRRFLRIRPKLRTAQSADSGCADRITNATPGSVARCRRWQPWLLGGAAALIALASAISAFFLGASSTSILGIAVTAAVIMLVVFVGYFFLAGVGSRSQSGQH